MSLRRILTVDADLAILKKTSAPVAAVDDDLRALMDDMLETMYAAPGIGLAAIQVGEPVRVIVMDLSRGEGERAPRHFVNPEIVWASEDLAVYEEGCLSVPEIYDEVAARRRRCASATSATTASKIEEDAEEPVRRLHPARDGPPRKASSSSITSRA